MDHPSDHLIGLSNDLLSYVRLINGTPIELSRVHTGIVLVETPHGNRSFSQRFAMELARQISGLCSLTVGGLGTTEFVLDTRKTPFRPEAFDQLESRCLLGMPALAEVEPEYRIFFLAITWMRLLHDDCFDSNATDFDEVLNSSFCNLTNDRVLFLQHRSGIPSGVGLKHSRLHELNFGGPEVSRNTLDTADNLVTQMLIRHLGQRSAAQWQKILRSRVPEHLTGEVDSLTKFANQLANDCSIRAEASQPCAEIDSTCDSGW